MQIHLNGESREVAEDLLLAALLDEAGLTGRRVAIEVNGEIIPRGRHASHLLSKGDRIEIVHALGGG